MHHLTSIVLKTQWNRRNGSSDSTLILVLMTFDVSSVRKSSVSSTDDRVRECDF